MNKNLRSLLAAKCKDFGLTDKALDELCKLAEGIDDNSTEEEIEAKADSLVPYARLVQGEITRKTRKPKTSPKKEEVEDDASLEDSKEHDADEIPVWAQKYLNPIKESLKQLQDENTALKAATAAADRKNKITSKAKELGIPSYLVNRIAISEEADIDKELSDLKQELVNNNLMPQDASSEASKLEDGMKADAKAWAESLPNF